MENLKDLYDDFEDEDKARESITYSDKIIASLHYSSLLYGEILPSGITRLCDKEHLNVANGGSVFYDLGCGSGKLAFHVDFFLVSISDILGHFFLSSFSVFLQYSNLKKVIGVELAPSRIRIAYDAVCKLEKIKPELYTVEKDPSDGNKWVHLTETQSGPFLEFQCRSIFQESLQDANFVLLDTKIYPVQYNTCLELLETTLNGSCVASYENLNDMALKQERKFSFEQLKINEDTNDRFLTSWAPKNGCHFLIYKKISLVQERNEDVDEAKETQTKTKILTTDVEKVQFDKRTYILRPFAKNPREHANETQET